MPNLITSTDISAYRDFSANIDSARIDPFIQEAQEIDLKAFLGGALYYALEQALGESPVSDIYDKLFNGDIYEDCNGDTVEYKGLKPALVYYAYSRFIGAQDVSVTRAGVVSKRSDYSDPITPEVLHQKRAEARKVGSYYLEEATKYLNEKHETYTLWACAGKKTTKNFSIFSTGNNSATRKY